MALPAPAFLAKNITCHSWNGNRSKLAVSPNNNEVHIMSLNGAEWETECILAEHDHLVTGIDWGTKLDRLLTCSEDRNAYVWTLGKDGGWKPTLVILRLNRAATNCQWSPKEDKFAVASGAKVVSVCHFEEEHDWWVAKHIKKHRSTVLSVDWHPNNYLLLTGSSDYKCRIFSAHIKGVDSKPTNTLGFGDKLPFGELLMELDMAGGWVHACRWSPSGNFVSFVGHDSTITFADVSKGAEPTSVNKIKLATLPLQSLLFLTETTVVAAGHDYAPMLFQNKGGAWKFVANLDAAPAKAAPAAGAPAAGAKPGGPAPAGAGNAMSMFKNKVELGQGENTSATLITTKHQNNVTCISIFKGQPNAVTVFATSGVDGKLIFWDVKALEKTYGFTA